MMNIEVGFMRKLLKKFDYKEPIYLRGFMEGDYILIYIYKEMDQIDCTICKLFIICD